MTFPCDTCLYQSTNQCDSASEVQDYIDPERKMIVIDTNTLSGKLLMWLARCQRYRVLEQWSVPSWRDR